MPTDITDAHFDSADTGASSDRLDAWERARPEHDRIEGFAANAVAYLAGFLIVAGCLVGSVATVLHLPLEKAIWAATGLFLSAILAWLRKS